MTGAEDWRAGEEAMSNGEGKVALKAGAISLWLNESKNGWLKKQRLLNGRQPARGEDGSRRRMARWLVEEEMIGS